MYSAFQLAVKYLQYYAKAASYKGHGVHSPFVFTFIKYVKNGTQRKAQAQEIEQVRALLLQNKTIIEVADFGAGSTLLKSNRRMVSKIAASSLKPKKYAQLLFRIVQFYKPQTILELGTSFGTTSAYLAKGNPAAKVYTLEGAPAIAQIARQNFAKLQLNNISIIEGDFANTLPNLLKNIKTFDLVFIDGHHRKAPTLQYFEWLLPHAVNDSIFIFDDIHWSVEMEEAWHEIQQHPSVTLSIDLFFIGIVWLKKEFLIKQQFSIRF